MTGPYDGGRRAPKVAPATDQRRFTDKRTGDTVVKVFQGDFYVTRDSTEVLSCILGSCVSACLRDPVAGVGGMNHFLLPHQDAEGIGSGLSDDELAAARSRYGNHAMAYLIRRLVAFGARRNRLEAKVFGGGRVLGREGRVGELNATFVEDYLAAEDIPILASSLRGEQPVMVRYRPVDGAAWVRRVQPEEAPRVAERERRRRVRLHKDAASGRVEAYD